MRPFFQRDRQDLMPLQSERAITADLHAAAASGALRVLHIVPSLDPRTGGVAEAVIQLVRHMAPFGCVSEVVTLDATRWAFVGGGGTPGRTGGSVSMG